MRVVSVDGEARKALKRYLNLRPRGVRRLGNPTLLENLAEDEAMTKKLKWIECLFHR